MTTPIANEIGAIFVPVRDIAAARDWYCRLVGVAPAGEILFGHLFVVPMQEGSGLVLDAKNAAPHTGKPLFHFNSSDLAAAREHVLSIGAADVSEIVDGAFFTFKDPDGNPLMVADVPKPARSGNARRN